MLKRLGVAQREDPELGNLEKMLKSALGPVSPRPDYKKDLNRRLSNYSMAVPVLVTPHLPKDTIGLLLGVFSGTILIVLGVRVMMVFISRAAGRRQMFRNTTG
jgi:hypothetical protein